MNSKDAIRKARKLRALAEGGATEGERSAAAYRLASFMAEHKLTDKDLEQIRHIKVWFPYKDAGEKLVILQAAFKFLDQSRITISPHSDGKRVAIFLPEDRRPYLERAIEDYRLKFKEERTKAIKALALAFVVKHKLQSSQPAEPDAKGETYTPEELEAAAAFMATLSDVELDPTRLIAPLALAG